MHLAGYLKDHNSSLHDHYHDTVAIPFKQSSLTDQQFETVDSVYQQMIPENLKLINEYKQD